MNFTKALRNLAAYAADNMVVAPHSAKEIANFHVDMDAR